MGNTIENHDVASAGTTSTPEVMQTDPTSKRSSYLGWIIACGACIICVSIAGLAVSYILSQRYDVVTDGNITLIVDNWRGEVSNYEGLTSYTISINRQGQKTLTDGRLWGEFGNISLDAYVYYINGMMHYRFQANRFNDEIQRAVDGRKTITFDLRSSNHVTLHSIRENFGDVTYIVDGTGAEGDRTGISFDGAVEIDAVTWRGISRLGTRF